MLCTQHLQRDALLRLPLRFPPKNYTKYLRTFKGLAESICFVCVLFFFRKLILQPLENSLVAMSPDGNNSNSHTLFCLSVEHSYINAKRFQDKIFFQGINYPSSIQSELRSTTSFSTASLVKTSDHNSLSCLSALKEALTAVPFLCINGFLM